MTQNSLRQAKLRQCLQQHVEGLRDAIQNNNPLCQDIDLHKIIDNMDKSVKSRLVSLEQFSKELLHIVFNVPQQHMPVYACVITYFLGVCLGLNQ